MDGLDWPFSLWSINDTNTSEDPVDSPIDGGGQSDRRRWTVR